MTRRAEIQLLITDVDNTLFDWVRSWAVAVVPMIDALARRLNEPVASIENRIRAVHHEWGATECPACARLLAPDAFDEIAGEYERSFVASAPTFDGVAETLARVRGRGTRVVAYTESPGSFTQRRLTLLGLMDFVDVLYARADEPCWSHDTGGSRCAAIPVARERLKPHPHAVDTIVADAGVPHARALFVGDNLFKDVSMAQRAGVHAAWARYGTVRRAADEAVMARLCHWTPRQTSVERTAGSNIRPDIVLENRLDELFEHFSFIR